MKDENKTITLTLAELRAVSRLCSECDRLATRHAPRAYLLCDDHDGGCGSSHIEDLDDAETIRAVQARIDGLSRRSGSYNGGVAMIPFLVYTPNSNELSHASEHESIEHLHSCLWNLLEMLRDDWVFCFAPNIGLEHRLTRDSGGVWRFPDGTPFNGPVLRVYWRTEIARHGWRMQGSWPTREKAKAHIESVLLKHPEAHSTITRVTVRPKRAR